MHYLFAVHFFESVQNRNDDLFYLMRLEFVLGLDLVIELTSFQEFHNDVERVIRLIDFEELHAVFVIEVSHYLYLLNEALLSLLLTVGGLFGEGLDGIVLAFLKFLCQVDRGEITLPYLLLRLEQLMEASLVDLELKDLSPNL